MSTPCRAARGVEVCLLSFLTYGLPEVSGQPYSPAAFPPGKNLQCPLNRRLGGPQSLPGRFGDQKNLLSLLGHEL